MVAILRITVAIGVMQACLAPHWSAAQQEYQHQIAGTPALRPSTFSLWMPERPTFSPFRGVLAVSDYEAGREIYDDPRFRGWALDAGFALLRFNMRNRNATLNLAKEQAAVDRLFIEALPHFATVSGRPEIAAVGVIYTGLSQAGWQAIAFADLAPERAIATLPIHDSTGDRAPQQGSILTGLGVPSLHLVGRNDNVNQGTLAAGNTYAQTIVSFVTARRAAGALVGHAIQPDTGHTQWEGNEPDGVPLMLDWLTAVVGLRVPPDPTLPLITLTGDAGWSGSLSVSFNASSPWITATAARIAPLCSVAMGDRLSTLWLPSYGFATQWHTYATSGRYEPYGPACPIGPIGPDVNGDCAFTVDDLYAATQTPADIDRDGTPSVQDSRLLECWLRRIEAAGLGIDRR